MGNKGIKSKGGKKDQKDNYPADLISADTDDNPNRKTIGTSVGQD